MTTKKQLIGLFMVLAMGLLMGQFPAGYRLAPLTFTTNNGTMYMGSNGISILTITNRVIMTDLIATNAIEVANSHASLTTTNTLTSAGTNVANLVFFTSINETNNMFLSATNSRVHASVPGTFIFMISAIMKSADVEAVRGSIWMDKNGTNIDNSATHVQFGEVTSTGTLTNLAQVIAVPITVDLMSTNDYVELYWWGSDAGMVLNHTAAGSGPTRPASPAVIMDVIRIGE